MTTDKAMQNGDDWILSIVTVVKDDVIGFNQTGESVTQAVAALDATESGLVEWVIIDSSSPALSCPTENGLPIKYVWQQADGVFEAMNTGIDMSNGHWILFLNAGDCLLEGDSLSILLRELSNSDALWGFAKVQFRSSAGTVLNEPDWSYRKHRNRLFACGRFPPHQGTVVQAAALHSLGQFDTRFRVTADYHAALKLALISHPMQWNWYLTSFEQGGISSSQWRQALREMHRARREVFQPSGVRRLREWIDTFWLSIKRSMFARVGSIWQ